MHRRPLALLAASLLVAAACGGSKSPNASSSSSRSDQLAAEVASFDVAVGPAGRFLVGVFNPDKGDVGLLTHPAELALIRKMLLLPELVESIAEAREPHHLPHYALELATAFHDFYERCQVINLDDRNVTGARLRLCAAAKIVLGRSLDLMGMSAPERM